MAHKYKPPKFWTCDCDRTTGGHIIDGLYSTCDYCGKHRHELKEIAVPSGLGGVFCVEILSVEDDCAKGRPVSYRIVAEEMRAIKKKMKHEKASYYKTHGLRKNATIELYLAGCDDEMVKAVTGHSGVEMLKNTVGRSGKESWRSALKRQEIKWNEARPKRESFNECFKNSGEGERE